MARIRKQIYELTPKDLESFPVWEYALDEEGVGGQNEATVRPFKRKPPVDPADAWGDLMVRAIFRLADGSAEIGYLCTSLASGFQGERTIVTDRGQVMFWYGAVVPEADRIAKSYEILGRDASKVFPIHYESAVELATGRVSGVINGFMHYRSFKDKTVLEVT